MRTIIAGFVSFLKLIIIGILSLLKIGIEIACVIIDLIGVILACLAFVIEALRRCCQESRKKKESEKTNDRN